MVVLRVACRLLWHYLWRLCVVVAAAGDNKVAIGGVDGVFPALVAVVQKHKGDAGAVTAASGALRNLAWNNGASQLLGGCGAVGLQGYASTSGTRLLRGVVVVLLSRRHHMPAPPMLHGNAAVDCLGVVWVGGC